MMQVHKISRRPYDTEARKIGKTANTTHQYSSGSQIIEERQSGNVTTQEVWSSATGLVLRDTYSGGSLSERLYMTRDADSNVTSAVTTSGNISQRMVYDAYGQVDFRSDV